MHKSKRKLSLDRETIMPLSPDVLGGVNGGDIGGRPPSGPSEGFICSNCTSVSRPTTSRPPMSDSISQPTSQSRPSGVVCL
jgi:hypothetical protein